MAVRAGMSAECAAPPNDRRRTREGCNLSCADTARKQSSESLVRAEDEPACCAIRWWERGLGRGAAKSQHAPIIA